MIRTAVRFLRRQCTIAIVVGTLLSVSPAFGQANDVAAYPSRPITMIVATEPGGAPDVIARILAEPLRQRLGQPIVVEAKPGAGTTVGSLVVVRAKPDGYTLLLNTVAMTISPFTMTPVPFDPGKDLVSIGHVATVPLIMVVNPDLKVKSVKELIALAKSRPGQLNYSTAGVGTLQHLTTELLKRQIGFDMVHIPYKSGSAAVQAVLSNNTQMFFAGMPPALPQVKAGKLVALAVSTDQRFPAAPDVPTMAEAGVPGFEADNWHALFAPAGTPDAIVRRLNKELNEVLALPDVQERLLQVGAASKPSTPEQLHALVVDDVKKWTPLIRELNVTTQ
jgi:tripartite-type tricarboxylate transporter receptor subunit TctC